MPQEDMTAAAFIGIALWLVFDTSFCTIRVFKTKKGLNYWSMALGFGQHHLHSIHLRLANVGRYLALLQSRFQTIVYLVTQDRHNRTLYLHRLYYC